MTSFLEFLLPVHTSLSWITRVQIAVDAARGLEYIHEHTKNHYVHRDIKTSNILLDGGFRAKVHLINTVDPFDISFFVEQTAVNKSSSMQISDFGLAKLLVRTGDEEASTTKVVGTFGYLAPE